MALKICLNSIKNCTSKLVTRKSLVQNNPIHHKLLVNPATNLTGTSIRQVFTDRWDPPYLETMKSKIPLHDVLNIQIKGYDFALVESYQSLIHSIANTMGLDVEDCWATPATQAKILRYKPRSALPEAEYHLSLYERNVQIVDVPSTTFALYLEIMEAALPQGVTLTVVPHTDDHDEVRYVPDYELDELKTQLNVLIESRKK
ncbi:39S ribosomal protein L48, mitochondrial [Nilaparvata lugens]|uniref:39S ribosomal protein L48, mitochondrial n=1 Tax=Nilaparvata lugens TaxID=108931 RepID=UPI00193C93D9|nr:39S ribosomal protein L48, mitochondrial [Nilaparvata lugens]